MRPFYRPPNLPVDLQTTDGPVDLDKLEADALKKLQDPDHRWATAVHEAAHFYYRKLVGDEPFFIGPYFSYNEKTEYLGVAVGGVMSDGRSLFECSDVARWTVAGWLWEDKLCPDFSKGEEGPLGDKAGFFDVVRTLNPTAKDEQIQVYWDAAKVEVRTDLSNDDIEKEIRAYAKDFEDFIVPWLQ